MFAFTKQAEYLFLLLFASIVTVCILRLTPIIYPDINGMILRNLCFLLSVGFVIISRLSIDRAFRQILFSSVAFVVALFIPVILNKFRIIRKLHWMLVAIGLLSIGTVLILGEITLGSKLSFTIFDITFQPSEFVKILFIFFLAGFLKEKQSFLRVLIATIVAAMHVLILVASTDLGAALIFFVAYIAILYAATKNIFYLLVNGLAASIAAVLAYQLFDHVQSRVLAYQDPFAYIETAGYQIAQSIFALASGGLFGTGLFQGLPNSIPLAAEDMVFSAISEEMGMLFGILVLLITIHSFLTFLIVGTKAKDNYHRLLCVGLASAYLFQVFLTVGGGVQFIPLTGVTLPLVSYGGSSVVATILVYFVIQAVAIKQVDEQEISYNYPKSRYPILEAQWQIALAYLILFGLLIHHILQFNATDKAELFDNKYNLRQFVLEDHTIKGNIYASGGELLASSQLDADGNYIREYPYGDLFAHSIGYDSLDHGSSGLEATANYYLMQSNIHLDEVAKIQEEEGMLQGDHVYTTLDVALQEVAERALGVYKGSIIVTDIETGAILAMVSNPKFDPNEIDLIWDDLDKAKYDSVLLNRATQGLYPPGSIFKLVTAIDYLKQYDNDIIGYEHRCNGTITIGDTTIHCLDNHVHGSVDLEKSLEESCNTSFAYLSTLLDPADYEETLYESLFFTDLDLEIPSSQASFDLGEGTASSDMIQTSFGQGKTLVTPMQMNIITAAIANDGIMRKPFFMDYVISDDKTYQLDLEQETYGTYITKEQATIMQGYMEQVVEEGTGSKLSGLDYSVAGKTGSAQYNESENDSHSWFTGFAPVENPEIAITIIMEEAGLGSAYAVPMAKRVLDEYFGE